MTDKTVRRPVGNFFVKKAIQLTIIGKIILVVLASTALTTLLLALVYNMKSQAGSFYYMSNNIMEDLKLQSILGLVLPAVMSAQIVSVLIAIGIGLFSSRKVAVPLYKIEKWASQLKNGNLRTRLGFRETREMRDLVDQCNAMVEEYRSHFTRIDELVTAIEKDPGDSKSVVVETVKLRGILGKIDFRDP